VDTNQPGRISISQLARPHLAEDLVQRHRGDAPKGGTRDEPLEAVQRLSVAVLGSEEH